jgi:hypothetical protein
MDKLYGVTALVIGGACLWGAIHLWHAKKKRHAAPGPPGSKPGGGSSQAGWHEFLILLLLAAGLGIGGGISLLFGLAFLYVKAGIVPLWLVLALITGIWCLVDIVARRGWTRTSALTFLTAVLIAVPVAPPALAAATHGRQVPQVISVTHKG